MSLELTEYQLSILLAIQRAREAGFAGLTAALVTLAKREGIKAP